MSDNELVKSIVDNYLVKFHISGLKQYFENREKRLYEFILNYTSMLDKKYPFSHRLYWVINNMTDFPLCKKCRKPNKRVIKLSEGYTGTHQYCCHKCCVSSQECVKKRKETNLDHWGVEVPAQNNEIKEKIKNTTFSHYGNHYFISDDGKKRIQQIILEKYGVDHISRSEIYRQKMRDTHKNRSDDEKQKILDKSKKTSLERYGYEYFSCTSDFKEKFKNTMISKYGVTSPAQIPESKEKSKETCLEKYGVPYVMQNDSVKEKARETCLEKYGTEYAIQTELVKNKVKETNIERYGVPYITQSEFFKNKIKEICLEKYGVPYITQSDLVKEKSRKTCLEKYGVPLYALTEEYKKRIIEMNRSLYGKDWFMQSEDFHNKSKKTMLEKYGVDNIFKSDFYRKKIRIKKLINTYNRLLTNTSIQPQFSLKEFLDNPFNQNFKWKCLSCGKIFESPRSGTLRCEDSLYARCYDCYPSTGHSVPEKEIYDMISQYCNDCILGDKSLIYPKEIDIYIPSKNLAIEFDGLYWHSNQMLRDDHKYHLDKTEKLIEKDIQLIHIFDDEWNFKKNIVLSRIKNLIGVYDKAVYARKCNIKNVSFEESRIFLDNNHIQGNCNSLYRYGLYYNNELISIMTFGGYRKSLGRKNKQNEYELLRFCNKLGYHIPGAASRLFKHFVIDHNPLKVISYADRRWSKGNLYEKLGFKFIKNTDVNYWYIIGDKRQHRFAWRKSILKNKLEKFNESKTEYENMLDNNIDCIYDCGNMLFEWIPDYTI